MSEKIRIKTIWHEAGISALILSAICCAYFLINNFLEGTNTAMWKQMLSFVLDAAKIFACIYFMRLFMYRFKQDYPGADRSDLRRLGFMIGILSGFIYSALTMAYLLWNPETTQAAIDTVISSMGQSMDRNTLNVMDSVLDKLPQITFISNFIYCTLWAWILPAILAPRIISDNPFDDDKE